MIYKADARMAAADPLDDFRRPISTSVIDDDNLLVESQTRQDFFSLLERLRAPRVAWVACVRAEPVEHRRDLRAPSQAGTEARWFPVGIEPTVEKPVRSDAGKQRPGGTLDGSHELLAAGQEPKFEDALHRVPDGVGEWRLGPVQTVVGEPSVRRLLAQRGLHRPDCRAGVALITRELAEPVQRPCAQTVVGLHPVVGNKWAVGAKVAVLTLVPHQELCGASPALHDLLVFAIRLEEEGDIALKHHPGVEDE